MNGEIVIGWNFQKSDFEIETYGSKNDIYYPQD